MYLFVVALHVVLCVFMVLIILLQPAKGEVGLAFGGGGGGGSGSSIFGPRGSASLLQRATTVVAVLFMVTSITLALYSNKKMLANANVDDEFENILRDREALQVAPAGSAAPVDPAGPGSVVPEDPAPIEEPPGG